MERYPDDIGWRYAYTHSYIADFVLNLKTKEVKLIHEAQ